jgi:hypothetical protein
MAAADACGVNQRIIKRGTDMRADLLVFARDFPEIRLVGEVSRSVSTPLEVDPTVRAIVRYMWGANCHHGLIFTPETTFVLRDDFSVNSPDAIRVAHTLSTERVLSRMGVRAGDISTERGLAEAARKWLERLAASYDAALPDDPDVNAALFPEVVSAVAGGRVDSEGR